MRIFYNEKGKHIVIIRMEPYWTSWGHFLSNDLAECDVQLSLVRIPEKVNLPTLLRIDGIYYDADTDYNTRNSGISLANSIADGVVYQSTYSKTLCEKFLAPRKKGAIVNVIYNGIDKDWCGKRVDHSGINIVVVSKWRRHKRLQEIIDIFLHYLRTVPNSTLHIVGKLHDNKPVKHPAIVYHNMVDRSVLGKILNEADFSIHLSKRDSCPNSVVECIGAGIPVITTDKCGGATEMCLMSEGCIVCEGDFDNDFEAAYPYRDEFNIITPKLKENILSAMIRLARSKVICELPKQLTAEYMAREYIKVMEEITK